ncbi:MAG: hypothetical protein LUG21_08035 [Clostridiales bacterium]|nr:hypothetical protein [Clostridiales bacterium]
MKKYIKYLILSLSCAAILYTLWYMHFGNLTDNNGALSKTGLEHPVLFSLWGILTYAAIYSNILYLYKILLRKYKFQYYMAAAALFGIILTVSCRFDISFKVEYYFHCGGSLGFSIITGVCVFLLYLNNFNRCDLFKAFTILTGLILIADLIFLIIYKQNALIETVPVIFALIEMPITIFYLDKSRDKAYAAR